MSRPLLLIACSGRKLDVPQARAAQLYQGALFDKAYLYGCKHGLDIRILSARYGFVLPQDIIETYNVRFKKPYNGPWPDGSGWYVGGKMYFGNAPDRFVSLTGDPKPIGKMLQELNRLLGFGH